MQIFKHYPQYFIYLSPHTKNNMKHFTIFTTLILCIVSIHLNAQEKYGVIDLTGQYVVPAIYDYIPRYEDGIASSSLLIAEKDGYYGLININNQIIAPFEYTGYGKHNENWAKLRDKNGNWGVIDKEGKTIMPFVYDSLYYYGNKNNTYIVEKNSKFGLINLITQQIVLPVEYDDMEMLEYDISFVKMAEDSYAIYNGKGKQLTMPGYLPYKSKAVSPTLIIAAKENADGSYRMHLIDNEGKVLSDWYDTITTLLSWEDITSSGGHIFEVTRDNKIGLLDSLGTLVVPCEYEDISIYDDKYITVKKENGWGLTDFSNKSYFSCINDEILICDKNRFIVKQDSEYFLKDSLGNILIDNGIDELLPTHFNNRYLLYKNGEWAVIDENKNEIIPHQYYKPESLEERNAFIVGYKPKYGVRDINGKELLPSIYDHIEPFGEYNTATEEYNDVYYLVRKGRLEGVVDSHNKEIIPIKHDEVESSFAVDSFVAIRKDQGFALYNFRTGEFLTDFKYHYIHMVGRQDGLYLYEACILHSPTTRTIELLNAKGEVIFPHGSKFDSVFYIDGLYTIVGIR